MSFSHLGKNELAELVSRLAQEQGSKTRLFRQLEQLEKRMDELGQRWPGSKLSMLRARLARLKEQLTNP